MGKTLFVDCQFFQTPAWHRGMGRYTLSLLKNAFIESQNEYRIVMIFSSHLPKDPEMMSAIESIFNNAEQFELDLQTTENVRYKTASIQNKTVLQNFIKEQRCEESAVYFIPCHFQDPTATIFPDHVDKILIYYDAVPLLYYDRYKNAIKYDDYIDRYRSVIDADTILTISQTVSDDLAIYLGVQANEHRRITNIDGACIDGMMNISTKPKKGYPDKYILATTSDDLRKNNEAAIKAFEQLRKLTKTDYKLVITSTFEKHYREHLETISKNLIFTGNISDDELTWLYENAQTILFTSEYEGLGLPILEAVKVGVPVACSSISVFREISNSAFYFFDPLDIEDITLNLFDAIKRTNWDAKRKEYKNINKRYDWKRSAQMFNNEVELLFTRSTSKKFPSENKNKLKIAVLAPTPQGYSAIGKVVQELHDSMSLYFDIDYYFEDKKKDHVSIRPLFLRDQANCFQVEKFSAKLYSKYDLVIYHIGNSEYHLETIRNALYLPGIIIAHDCVLTEVFGELVAKNYLPLQRMKVESVLDEKLQSMNAKYLTSLLNNQLGVIVHSEYAMRASNIININNVPILKAELPVAITSQNVQDQQKHQIHIGFAGVLSGKRKGVNLIKELVKNTRIKDKIVIHMFGFNFLDEESMAEIRKYESVRIETNLSDLAYQSKLSNLDILINFRTEYRGETSLTALEAMRYGCITIVNGAAGWFGELPDNAVVKVVDTEEIPLKIEELIQDKSRRRLIGEEGKKYIANKHSQSAYAIDINNFIENIQKNNNQNNVRSEVLKTSKNLGDVEKKIYRILEDMK